MSTVREPSGACNQSENTAHTSDDDRGRPAPINQISPWAYAERVNATKRKRDVL